MKNQKEEFTVDNLDDQENARIAEQIDERKRKLQAQRAKRRRDVLIMKCVISVLVLVITFLAVILVKDALIPGVKDAKENRAKKKQQEQMQQMSELMETEELETEVAEQDLIAEADRLAAMYDYDKAIALVKSSSSYTSSQTLQDKVASYEATKATCQPYPLDQVTHVFFHSMIKDTAKAFDGDITQDGYNQVMTTMSEFAGMMESMYEKGYVMVSLHDMCIVNSDGTVSKGEIMLPPGKKPFVLSQDDVSYYHYMDGDGYAQKLIIDENGDVKNTYIEDDGSISVGDYDMVPWIDTFVDAHPDFSYRGRKGIIALTGYEGVLGYRTDEVYRTKEAERVTVYQQMFFDANPNFDEAAWQKEVDEATAVAAAMRADGWEFASHTWGHIAPQVKGLDGTKRDTERWLNNVETIVGDTDVIIFAFGADIGDWQPYTMENPFFAYMKEKGFNIFCNVDSSPYWVQFGNDYMRQARRNLDGYRMYYNPEMLTDLFDVNEVWDNVRPTPVPAI